MAKLKNKVQTVYCEFYPSDFNNDPILAIGRTVKNLPANSTLLLEGLEIGRVPNNTELHYLKGFVRKG
jgi:hypothetical protein